jgi:hypothetical protein
VLQEISGSLAERYAGPASVHDNPVDGIEVGATGDGLSESDAAREIRRQDASKTCGLDGVHMRVIKSLLPSCLTNQGGQSYIPLKLAFAAINRLALTLRLCIISSRLA